MPTIGPTPIAASSWAVCTITPIRDSPEAVPAEAVASSVDANGSLGFQAVKDALAERGSRAFAEEEPGQRWRLTDAGRYRGVARPAQHPTTHGAPRNGTAGVRVWRTLGRFVKGPGNIRTTGRLPSVLSGEWRRTDVQVAGCSPSCVRARCAIVRLMPMRVLIVDDHQRLRVGRSAGAGSRRLDRRRRGGGRQERPTRDQGLGCRGGAPRVGLPDISGLEVAPSPAGP